MLLRRPVPLVSVALATLVALGCGGAPKPSGPVARPVGGVVTIVGGKATTKFVTQRVEVPVAKVTTVRLDNRGSEVPHDVVIKGMKTVDGKAAKTPLIRDDTASFKIKPAEAGTFRYLCDIHPIMVGELRVTEP